MARIAFLLPNLTPGGAERVGLTLAQSFIERGHEVDLLVAEKRGALLEQVPPGVRLIDLDAKRIREVPSQLIRYLRERRPDALQVSLCRRLRMPKFNRTSFGAARRPASSASER